MSGWLIFRRFFANGTAIGLQECRKSAFIPNPVLLRFFKSGRLPALSNRAEFRARHGLDISLRFSVAGRLSFHAAWGLLEGGYAGLGCTSVSRLLHRNAAVGCGTDKHYKLFL
jgi:hypothetical protein